MNAPDYAEIDIQPDATTSYLALRRAIQRGMGFSLLFVRCTPVKGEEIIKRIQEDLPLKRVQVLNLDANTENLYNLVQNLQSDHDFDVLFIRGLEESLFQHEDREALGIENRSRSTGYGGNWESVPRILGHLNLSRERFRDNFQLCFVFLLPEFALNYFIRRAPDFFDWRSNVYKFPTERELVSQESFYLAYLDCSYEEYCKQLPEQRIAKLSKIKSYLEEESNSEERSTLWLEKGLIHMAANEQEEAIKCYENSIQLTPNGYYWLWRNKGNALVNLGRYEEAITAYDKALEIKSDDHQAWYGRGITLGNLGRYEEAIAAFDKALECKLDYHEAWYSRGIALDDLGRYEEAITSYDKAIVINSSNPEAYYNKFCTYYLQNNIELALENLRKAIQLNPEKYRELAKIDSDFDNIRHDPRFQALIQ